MTFLEELQAHKGGLILLKSDLLWYGGRGWDGCPGRVCLILDAGAAVLTDAAARHAARAIRAAACLLIDGRPHWVLVGSDDLELL